MNQYIVGDIQPFYTIIILLNDKKECSIALKYYKDMLGRSEMMNEQNSIQLCIYNLKFRLDSLFDKLLIYFEPYDPVKHNHRDSEIMLFFIEEEIGKNGFITQETKKRFEYKFGFLENPETKFHIPLGIKNFLLGYFVLKKKYVLEFKVFFTEDFVDLLGLDDYGLNIWE
jgi:hypothetical protein